MPERPAKPWDIVAWALLAPLAAAPLSGITLFLIAVNFQPVNRLCQGVGDVCYQLLGPLIPATSKVFLLHAIAFSYPAILAGDFIASALAWRIWSEREAVIILAISLSAQFVGFVLLCQIYGLMGGGLS